jgi:signal transduction histidine kinase
LKSHAKAQQRLIEQMLRNLLSNALKYTKRGKVLLGCRRRKGLPGIEVWDIGIGIPAAELGAIFEEYHQVDNVARERSLGLAIVQRLGNLRRPPLSAAQSRLRLRRKCDSRYGLVSESRPQRRRA